PEPSFPKDRLPARRIPPGLSQPGQHRRRLRDFPRWGRLCRLDCARDLNRILAALATAADRSPLEDCSAPAVVVSRSSFPGSTDLLTPEGASDFPAVSCHSGLVCIEPLNPDIAHRDLSCDRPLEQGIAICRSRV